MSGLTGCQETIKCFLGRRAIIRQTKNDRLAAYFDVSWGINEPEYNRFATWRHCIAYGETANQMREYKQGAYLRLAGWVTTNPIYDSNSNKKLDINGNVITGEYLIVDWVTALDRANKPAVKQLSLVGGESSALPPEPEPLPEYEPEPDNLDDFPF